MKSVPKKILLFAMMAYLLPFIMQTPFTVFMGGLTLRECHIANNNPISLAFYILAIICPIVTYILLNKKVKAYDGSQEGIVKLNKFLKIYELVSFAIPITFVVLSSIIVPIFNMKNGFSPEAFAGGSYLFYSFAVMFSEICAFSVISYILVVSYLEKAVD